MGDVAQLRPKPIKINGFEGVMVSTENGLVEWKIARIMQVEFSGTSPDEQTAMREMHSFINDYNSMRTAVQQEIDDGTDDPGAA